MQTDATWLGVVASVFTKLKGFLCATTRNNAQQRATGCENVTYYNVGSCWPRMLRPFTQGLMIHWFVLGLLETRTLESESHGQTNRPHRYKCGKVSRLISDTCDTVDTCFVCEQRVEIVWGLSESKRRSWKLNGFGETIAAQQHSHIELGFLFIRAADYIKQRFLFSFSWQLYILPFFMHIYMYSL